MTDDEFEFETDDFEDWLQYAYLADLAGIPPIRVSKSNRPNVVTHSHALKNGALSGVHSAAKGKST